MNMEKFAIVIYLGAVSLGLAFWGLIIFFAWKTLQHFGIL